MYCDFSIIINQLLLLMHNICKSFNDGYKVRGVFLDKVWHDGLNSNYKKMGYRVTY